METLNKHKVLGCTLNLSPSNLGLDFSLSSRFLDSASLHHDETSDVWRFGILDTPSSCNRGIQANTSRLRSMLDMLYDLGLSATSRRGRS
jgi:hypothetical protein